MVMRVSEDRAGKPQQANGHPTLDLETFLTRLYGPLKLLSDAERIKRCRGAIRWLARSLSRPALLSDLTADDLLAVQRYMLLAQIGRPRIKAVRGQLGRLWKFAHRLGYVDRYSPPPVIGSAEFPTTDPRYQDPASPGTVLHFYRTAFRPPLLAKAQQTLSGYDCAINRFHDYCGRLVTLAEVDADRLDCFERWLIDGRQLPHAANKAAQAIRAILRAHDSSRFPKPPPTRGRNAPPPLEVRTSDLPAAEPGTLRHLYETVYRPQRGIDWTEQTCVDNLTTLRYWFVQLGRDVRIDELTDSLAADHFRWLRERGLSNCTINNHRARLFALWRFAVELGQLEREPKVRRLKVTREEPDAWSEAEARRIIAAARKIEVRGRIGPFEPGEFWHATLLVDWYTALRKTSLFKIRRDDVNLDTGWMYAQAVNMKHRRGKHFRLGGDCVEAVRKIWQPERELLLARPYKDHRALYRHFNRILKLAKIEPSPGRSLQKFHKWRRTVATHAAKRAGLAAASTLLGHSGEYVTKLYIDPSQMPGNDATWFLPPMTDSGGHLVLLERAQKLLGDGDAIPAAMTARVALERHLSELCRRLGFHHVIKQGLGSMLDALRRANRLPRGTRRRMERLLKIANRAAHGEAVDLEDVRELLSGIRAFCASVASRRRD